MAKVSEENPAEENYNSRPTSGGENQAEEKGNDRTPLDGENPAVEKPNSRAHLGGDVYVQQPTHLQHPDEYWGYGTTESYDSDDCSDSSDNASYDDCDLRNEYIEIENEGKTNKDKINFLSKSGMRRFNSSALLNQRNMIISLANQGSSVVRVDSAPMLASNHGLPAFLANRISKAELVVGSIAAQRASSSKREQANMGPASQALEEQEDPRHVYSEILKKHGLSSEVRKGEELSDFFIEMGEANVTGYTMDKVTAMRNEDIDALRSMYSKGETLQVCNQFGESIIHSACRRGLASVMRFLVEEANVSLAVKDDYWKTPAHDACWTTKPNFDVMKTVVTACPDLFLVADKRGSTPLDYTQRSLWGEWCEFLKKNEDILMPKMLRKELKVGEKRKSF